MRARYFKRITFFLLPSPLQCWLSPAPPHATSPNGEQVFRSAKEASKLAHLDALRGIACLVVINQHFTTALTTAIYTAWGGPCVGPVCPIPNHYFTQLPYVNLFWNGHAMVAVFFVISGQVLSHSTLKHARSLGRASSTELPTVYSRLLLNITSSTFRRTFRLYLPIVASTLLVALASYAGLYAAAKRNQDTYWMTLLTSEEPTPDRFDTLQGQLGQWLHFLVNQVRNGSRNELDRHTWTIPVEWNSSMTVFLVLAALCRMRFHQRTFWLVTLIAYAAHFVDEGNMLFLSGILIADLNLALGEPGSDAGEESSQRHPPDEPEAVELLNAIDDGENPPSSEKPSLDPWFTSNSWLLHHYLRQASTLWHTFLILLAGYLLSFPYEQAENTPGYRSLASTIPTQWSTSNKPFHKYIGAITLVWIVNRSTLARKVLSGKTVQYVGKLSFALYLVHGPVIRSLGYVVIPPVKRGLGAQESMLGFCAAWFVCAVCVGVVVWWVADLFERVVDAPSVWFGRWVERKCV